MEKEWEELINECNNCQKCSLVKNRKNVVIGKGNRRARVLFIGEGPGEQEDKTGIPFVGLAGKLLDLLFEAFMFEKKDYYIANIVKCRPPGNRVPTPEEAEACMPYLKRQIELINPDIIVCLGATALKNFVDKNARITKIRGQWIEKEDYLVLPTFHPAALLRDNTKKIPMWEDFKKIRKRLDVL